MKNLIFLGGDRVHELKVDGWGEGCWTVFRFKGEGGLVKKGGGSLSLILEERVHAMALPNQLAPKQIINLSENDCIIAEILQKRLSDE